MLPTVPPPFPKWSCAPATVYVSPAAPKSVTDAVNEWLSLFRPDWHLTTSLTAATVDIYMRHPKNPAAAGLTTIYGTATEILHADVELDPKDPDMPLTVRHELGHVAGLEHNSDRSSAMSPTPSPSTRRHYGARDIIALLTLRNRCLKETPNAY